MKWRAPADRRVVEAVIATFCDSAERSHHRLSALQLRDWQRKRLRGHFYQARYTLFRLRFHISQDIHYLIESTCWKRHLAALHDYAPHPVAEKPHLTKSEYQ